MLKQALSLKQFFSWKELLGNARAMKRARVPLRGYVTTISIWALIEVGLWEKLAQGKRLPLQEFATAHHLNPQVLLAICRYLQRLNYVTLNGDQVCLSRQGRRFWNQVYGAYHLFRAYEPLFTSLVQQLTDEARFGANVFRREQDVAQGFDELGQKFMFPILDGILRQEGFNSIIDLGCGEIYLSSYLCRRHPTRRCLGIDHEPEVLEKAGQKAQEAGVSTQIALLLADMFAIDEVDYDFSMYEVVTAIDLFHGYYLDGEAKLIELFEKLGKIFRRQKFLISEICLPPPSHMKTISYPYVEHELFHDLTKQKSFAAGELESLFERVGFTIEKRWNFNKVAGRVCLLLQPPPSS